MVNNSVHNGFPLAGHVEEAISWDSMCRCFLRIVASEVYRRVIPLVRRTKMH